MYVVAIKHYIQKSMAEQTIAMLSLYLRINLEVKTGNYI